MADAPADIGVDAPEKTVHRSAELLLGEIARLARGQRLDIRFERAVLLEDGVEILLERIEGGFLQRVRGPRPHLFQRRHQDGGPRPAIAQCFRRRFEIFLRFLLARTLQQIELARRRLIPRILEDADRPFHAVGHEEPFVHPVA